MWTKSVFTQSIWLLVSCQWASAATVDWTSISTSRGDRLPDFSFCGYHASDKEIPSTDGTPIVTVKSSSGDQNAKIQQALDQAAASGGGVVRLAKGTFHVSSGLVIPSNVVLQGAGITSTYLAVDGLKAGIPVLSLGNGTASRFKPERSFAITDEYIGIGAKTVTVQNAEGIKAGQSVFVSRAVTAAWVRDNGMADLVRDDEPQTWIQEGVLVQQPRVVEKVSGNKVTFTVPLTDSLDSKYMSPYLAVYSSPPKSYEIGVEDLSITRNPSCSGLKLNASSPCAVAALSVAPWTVDSWVRGVNITGFNSFLEIQSNSSRITIEKLSLFRDADTDNAAGYPADISIQGSQVLIRESGQYGLSTAKAFAVVTQSGTPGPNAVLRHVTQANIQQLYPHQRWAHGFLVDDTDASASFINRGTSGSGHGWSINAGVTWNVRGDVQIQSPPLGVNWGVGSTGKIVSPTNGTMLGTGSKVTPQSLFEAQLSARKT